MSDRISIVIRSSARPELAEALGSVADQSYRNVDVVIVNVTGRPHPPLPPQAAALAVTLVEPGRPLPRPDAANAGLDTVAHRDSDHAVFLDDDDLLDPDHLGALVDAVREDRTKLPFTGAQIHDEHDTLQSIWTALPFGALEIVERIRLQPSAALIPRAVIDEGFRFDPNLPIFEDWDYWIRVSRRIAFRPLPANTAIARIGLGTSGTGTGANFDLERTARDSQPFHAKWEPERIELAARFDALRDEAAAALERGDWSAAERACWDSQALRIWDASTLECLSRIFAARRQPAQARRFADAAERARRLAPRPLTREALTRLHAHLTRGNAAALAGEASSAEREFVEALALHPGDQTACNGLANLRIADDRLAEAEALLRQGSLWGDRTYPTMVLKRGSLLEALGRHAEARALYEHLSRLVPRYGPARERMHAVGIIAAAA